MTMKMKFCHVDSGRLRSDLRSTWETRRSETPNLEWDRAFGCGGIREKI